MRYPEIQYISIMESGLNTKSVPTPNYSHGLWSHKYAIKKQYPSTNPECGNTHHDTQCMTMENWKQYPIGMLPPGKLSSYQLQFATHDINIGSAI